MSEIPKLSLHFEFATQIERPQLRVGSEGNIIIINIILACFSFSIIWRK